MLRYLRRLSARDYALDRGMIPLGSCTMKLNATTEMEPVSLPGFADLHPFAPAEDALGYRKLIDQLESWLADVTGYDRVSIQPNAGSQGELAGLLAIRAYHQANGEGERRVCLIPSSAHGTNAASAVMAGMKVVVVKSAADGSVDMDDLKKQCDEHRDDLAAIMVTYPSTHGAYEDTISDLCETGARRRRPGLRRRREPQRAARLREARASSAATCRTSTCTRRSASRTVAVDRASARSACASTWRRTSPRTGCTPSPRSAPASARSALRRTARPGSCRSRGRSCG